MDAPEFPRISFHSRLAYREFARVGLYPPTSGRSFGISGSGTRRAARKPATAASRYTENEAAHHARAHLRWDILFAASIADPQIDPAALADG
jgi:hypothetical protein